MHIRELREMSDEQLEATAKEAMENIFRMRIQAQTERNDATQQVRKNRRVIAKVRTLQKERTK
jgi:large subunit ribosomal protein L29